MARKIKKTAKTAASRPARRASSRSSSSRWTSSPDARLDEHAPVILDVAGTTLTADDRRRLAHPLTGGAILFGRNWVNRQQVTELVAEMKAIRPDLLVCVDHEGGRVQRFRTDGFTHLPAMDAYGKRWMDDGAGPAGDGAMAATDAATAAGFVMAAELRSCGVDLSFAPVLDLHFGHSAVIGDRSFHRDARIVTLLAKSLMLGMRQAGMANCGKHFPGHGHVAADSHVDVPVDPRPLAEILLRRRAAVRVAVDVAGQRDAGPRRLPRRRRQARRLLGAVAAGHPARAAWASPARSSATT